MKLNLGCGSTKITGCVNVDAEESTRPDMCFDLKKKFPLEDEVAESVYLFHTIEHIEKKHWGQVLGEIHRVLKEDGEFILSYPEFSKIAQNWLDNKQGKKEFWEHTIYGLQRYPGDYHVSLMDSTELQITLFEIGFKNILFRPEPIETYNTICTCITTGMRKNYEQVLYEDVFLNQ